MLLCPRYWLRLKGFVWVYLLPAWCWSDRQKGAVFCSDIVMYQLVVNVRALAWAQVCVCWWYAFMCAHPRKCIMHHIAWVSLLPVRVCLWAKVYTKLYRGNSFIHLSNYTPHLTFKGEEIAAWFWLIVDFKALHKAKQCWHTVLTAAGSEKLSGMSGHTKCILTQAIPIRCFVSLMKPRWRVTSVRAWLCRKSKSSQSDQSINSDQRAVSHKHPHTKTPVLHGDR